MCDATLDVVCSVGGTLPLSAPLLRARRGFCGAATTPQKCGWQHLGVRGLEEAQEQGVGCGGGRCLVCKETRWRWAKCSESFIPSKSGLYKKGLLQKTPSTVSLGNPWWWLHHLQGGRHSTQPVTETPSGVRGGRSSRSRRFYRPGSPRAPLEEVWARCCPLGLGSGEQK